MPIHSNLSTPLGATAYFSQYLSSQNPAFTPKDFCTQKICTFILTFIFPPFATLTRFFSKGTVLEINPKPLQGEVSQYLLLTAAYRSIRHHPQAVVSIAILTVIFVYTHTHSSPSPKSSAGLSTTFLGIGALLLISIAAHARYLNSQQTIDSSSLYPLWHPEGISRLYQKYSIGLENQKELEEFIREDLPDLALLITKLYPTLDTLPNSPPNQQKHTYKSDAEGVIHTFLRNIQKDPSCDLQAAFYNATCTYFDKEIPYDIFVSISLNQIFFKDEYSKQLLEDMHMMLKVDRDIKEEERESFKEKAKEALLKKGDEIFKILFEDKPPDPEKYLHYQNTFLMHRRVDRYAKLKKILPQIYKLCKDHYFNS